MQSMNRILVLVLSSAMIMHAAPSARPAQKTESARSHNLLATLPRIASSAYSQLTRQPAVQATNKQTKPVIPFGQKKLLGRPHVYLPNKFFDEDGNEYDYNTMTVRFNPCVNGISSRVCVIDSKVTELDEHLTSCCDEINANVDSCCAQLGTELASCCEDINTNIDSCCSTLENLIIHVDEEVHNCCQSTNEHIDSCCADLDASIDSCCADLDASIDSCCSQIESHLTVIEQKIDDLSPDAIESCCDRLSGELQSCCDTLESLIGNIDTDLASCCEEINSKLDAACGATAIHQSDLPYVIREPGHYCVAENLQGTSPLITISSSDVHLDLNGYELRQIASGSFASGIIMTDNSTTYSSVVIHNGFLVGGGDRPGIFIGTFFPVRRHDDFVIEDVSIRNCTNGIECITANKIRIKDTICYSNTANGLRSASTTGLVVENSEFNSNTSNGIRTELLGTSPGENKQCSMFKNCSASDNVTAGFNIFGIPNPFFGNSFISEIVLDSCYTCSNGIGYRFDTITDTYVTQCVAHRNTTAGFSMNTTSTVSEAIVKECVAQGNGTFGFFDGAAATQVQYYANEACNNGDNYSPNIDAQNHAPVTSPANARGVDNVDCTRSDVDQIDILQSCCESLQSCCEQVNSKVDLLLDTCGATAIHQSDVPYTITEPGHYCVAENLDGTGFATVITIGSLTSAVSDVHLDLNGYEIKADSSAAAISIDLTFSHTGIVIENGFIKGADDGSSTRGIEWIATGFGKDLTLRDLSIYNFNAAGGSTIAGIHIEDVETIKILNCNVYNNRENIQLLRCDQIYIDQCLVSNATGSGLDGNGGTLEACKSVTIKNSSFFQNWMNGLLVNPNISSDVILIEDSLFNDNSLSGTTGDIAGLKLNSPVVQAHLVNCSFSITGNAAFVSVSSFQQYGLFVNATSVIAAEHCQAHNNLEKGFYISASSKVNLTDCQAQGNGFFDTLSQFGFGFHLEGSRMASVRDCYAADNFGHGFVIDEYNDSVFTNCVAERNGQNGSLSPNFPRGFIIAANSENVLFDHCVALRNRVDGFAVTSTACDTCSGGTPHNICFTQCTAKLNGDMGGNAFGAGFKFEVSGSSGLCKECVAVNNGQCGFDTYSSNVDSGFPKFVANLAQDNGTDPADNNGAASKIDTNYCVNGAATDPFDVTVGFTTLSPYYQVDTVNSAVRLVTEQFGTGYWTNVTLR